MTESDVNSLSEHLISKIQKENWPVYAMEVYKNGHLLNDYGNTKQRQCIYSITKSIVSIAAGIAENERLIDFSDSILKYLPEDYLKKTEENQIKLFENITIYRLLTMSVKGFNFRPETEDFLLYSLNSKIEPEKIEFNYSNICAYLVSVALTTAVGKPLYEYLKEKIFDPMEIDSPPYQLTEEGFFYGATGMQLSACELSKIGLMLLNNGMYKEKQIVSEDYIKRATSRQITIKEGGYGYFFWEFCNGFSLNGKWGQKCFCFPSEKIVLSVLGNFQNGSDMLKNEVKGWFN